MLSQTNLEKIKKITEEFLQKMSFHAEIEVSSQNEKTILINLKMDEPQILIGERGRTLFEIQHLLKVILKRKIAEDFYIDLDINDYKKKKNEYLKEMAQSVADEVALNKEEKELSPMPSAERRIIHLELSDRKDVITESIGREPERKVIIKPSS
jgi:spoIIIJ-associated protein